MDLSLSRPPSHLATLRTQPQISNFSQSYSHRRRYSWRSAQSGISEDTIGSGSGFIIKGWYPADPVTVKTSVGIARSVLFKKAYPTAPVSNLYFFDRPQDLAFEQPAGSSASQRHHVRFWQSPNVDAENGRPLWVGSATFDKSSGFSYLTGKVTHLIAADIDAERTATIASLEQVKQVISSYQVTGVSATFQGYNGGDWYYADREITVRLLSTHNLPIDRSPIQAPNPPTIQIKHHIWQ